MQKRLRCALLTTLLLPLPSMAEIELRGFATVGGGIFSESDFEYGSVDDSFTSDPYTRFALQIKSEINDRTHATGQFIARGTNDYQVEAEWAYLTLNLTDSVDFRAGRLRVPFFMYSDFLELGYAYPWTRPPLEVYRLIFSTIEGFDVIYEQEFGGGWLGTFQLYSGGLTDETFANDENLSLELNDYRGVNYSLASDWLTLRASYNQAMTTVQAPQALRDTLFPSLTGAGFGNVVDQLQFDEVLSRFIGFGINIDWKDFLIASEYTVLDFDKQTFLSSDTAWYAMLGRRFGDFTFHVTYSEQAADADYSVLNLIPNSAQTLPLELGVFQSIANDQDSVLSFGLRYDYSSSSAFKVEVSNYNQDTFALDNAFNIVENGTTTGTLVAFTFDVIF